MGLYAIKMPDIGEGIAEVELVAWRVKPGEEVKEDQILADVMTDKATVEIPAPVNTVTLRASEMSCARVVMRGLSKRSLLTCPLHPFGVPLPRFAEEDCLPDTSSPVSLRGRGTPKGCRGQPLPLPIH